MYIRMTTLKIKLPIVFGFFWIIHNWSYGIVSEEIYKRVLKKEVCSSSWNRHQWTTPNDLSLCLVTVKHVGAMLLAEAIYRITRPMLSMDLSSLGLLLFLLLCKNSEICYAMRNVLAVTIYHDNHACDDYTDGLHVLDYYTYYFSTCV